MDYESDLLNVCNEATNNLLPYSSECDYQTALIQEFTELHYKVKTETCIPKKYKNETMDGGKYNRLDLVVNDVNIIELKNVDSLKDEHRYQLIRYLIDTDPEIMIGYLINFRKRDGLVSIEKINIIENTPKISKFEDIVRKSDLTI